MKMCVEFVKDITSRRNCKLILINTYMRIIMMYTFKLQKNQNNSLPVSQCCPVHPLSQ